MDKVKTFEHKQRQLEESNRVLQMRIRVRSYDLKYLIFNLAYHVAHFCQAKILMDLVLSIIFPFQ